MYNIEKFKTVITRNSVINDSNNLYIFTDNLMRSSGKNIVDPNSWYYKIFSKRLNTNILYYPNVTLACMRGLNNAFPISTMYNCYKKQITDDIYDYYVKNIDLEIEMIKRGMNKFKFENILIVNKTIGVGDYSKMNIFATKCFDYLNKKLLEININNA